MTLATALIAASAGVQAMSSLQQGAASAANYKAQANAQEYNAQIQEQNAQRVRQENSIREDNLRKQQTQFLGRQRAAAAQSDTGLGTGSNLDIAQEDTTNAELDALTFRWQGEQEAQGLLQDATMSRYNASGLRMNAKSARTSSYLGAFGSVLGGAGRYYDYMQKTPPLPWQTAGNVKPGGGTY